MKKSLLVLTAALSFGAAAAQTTAPATAPQVSTLTDVPAGHWAKDAIDRLVSQGIILGYPDGTYRGTQNLTRYEAAVIIARLLDQVRQGTVPVESINTETLTALQNAIQELAADLTALGVRVSDLEENAVNRDDFTRLEARVEELAAANGDATAIAAIQTQIEELTARADEYDTLRGDIDDNAAQITALNELTVLLNQDILDLQDRVSAVETAQADFVTRSDFDNLAGRVTAVDERVTGVATRVTTLENAPKFSVVGALTSGFGQLSLVSGTNNFDITRLTSRTPVSGLLGDTDVTTVDTTGATAGVDRFFNAGNLTFGIRATNLRTTTGSIIVNNAGLNFGLTTAGNVANTGSVANLVQLRSANLDGTIGGQPFTVNYNGSANAFKFSDYLFNHSGGLAGPGVVATIQATTLPLRPTLTVVTGNTASPALTAATGSTASQGTVNYFGVRAAVKPTETSNVGISYAQGNRTAFGLDYNARVSILTVQGEGVLSAPNILENNFVAGNGGRYFQNADRAFYTNVTGDLGIVKFGANYRTIDSTFTVTDADGSVIGNAGMSTSNSMPYSPGQTGFGAAAATTVGPVALGAYADRYTTTTTSINNAGTAADATDDRRQVVPVSTVTGFGVKAGAKLGALELVGFYNNTTRNGDTVRSADNLGNAGMGIAGVPRPMTSTFGAQLSHNGAAENALVRNLNFTVGDAYFYSDPLNEFYAYADYSTTVAGITLQPLVRYQLQTDRLINDRDGNGTLDDETNNTIKYGIRASTATLTGLPLQPSLYANFVNRITNSGTDFGVQNGTTTELLGQVGVAFNQFLAPSATAKIGYSYYQGFNVASVNVGTGDNAFNAASNNVYAGRGAESGKADGIYAQLGFSGLTANYGLFRYTNLLTNNESVAQGFRVSYNFNF
ncbi:S-layer homology domain-containing protein [Deinococcus sp. MIMF12]|uniref:S-layer homology domain-containing protein n=1 Tax=Deinococcus rhizophilus TaxID=3049544 RepID=A0ABT7JJT1_9DEIO|nr:S-layer homology domain-containing protein [Deinococcus rhizophilus]MDL2345314.1 S-layer homology domain-containing protein [Deinococcus rhizophilus]